MPIDKTKYTNEGGSAKVAIFELYNELLNRYSRLGVTDKFFEINFIHELANLQSGLAGLQTQLPPFERWYIDMHLDELHEMEKALSNLEKRVSELQSH